MRQAAAASLAWLLDSVMSGVKGQLPWAGVAGPHVDRRWSGSRIRLSAIDRAAAISGILREGDAVLYQVIGGGQAMVLRWDGDRKFSRHIIGKMYSIEILSLP